MAYISTRGGQQLGHFCDVLLSGLAADGGLAMPEHIVHFSLDEIESWRDLSYADLAYKVMCPYIDDINESDLRSILHKTYNKSVFNTDAITPLTQLGNDGLYLLELSNGPSLAFKDIAMQFLGNAFEFALMQRSQSVNILGATSGDTGSAAEYAMIGKNNVNVFMLSPYGRMSAFQQAQMFSIDEPNIFNIVIKGVFDDCQDLVKAVNADAEFKREHKIGAVNSINWARVLAQSVYYFKAYLALNIKRGGEVDFCVPSGNFGNVFAGYFAKLMGLPISNLVVATNENDVLNEFFSTGVYRVRSSAEVAKTSSPSMDIGKASNFERFLYLLAGGEGAQVRQWYDQIAQTGQIDLSNEDTWSKILATGFTSGRSGHAQRLETIKAVYEQFNRLIDPHTADGVYVAQLFRSAKSTLRPMVCLETALPVKFEETVAEAVNAVPPRPARFDGIEQLPRHVDVLENDVAVLKQYLLKHLE